MIKKVGIVNEEKKKTKNNNNNGNNSINTNKTTHSKDEWFLLIGKNCLKIKTIVFFFIFLFRKIMQLVCKIFKNKYNI